MLFKKIPPPYYIEKTKTENKSKASRKSIFSSTYKILSKISVGSYCTTGKRIKDNL